MNVKPLRSVIGKTIKKVGLCPHEVTFRIIFDDGSMLCIDSVTNKSLIKNHGLVAKTVTDKKLINKLSDNEHMDWFDV